MSLAPRARIAPITDRRLLRIEELEARMMLSAAPTITDVHVSSTEWSSAFFDYVQSHNLGDHGYRVPTGSVAQTKSLPWFNIDQLVLTFSEDVDVQAVDLALSGVNVPSVPVVDFFYDAFSHVATWTFDDPLPNNRYNLELNADGIDPVVDLEGNRLDGEWTNNVDVFASGNGVAGGDFEFQFTVLPGDVDQNGTVNFFDRFLSYTRQGLTTLSGNYLPRADIDGSGVHELLDTQDINAVLSTTSPSGSPIGAANDAPGAIAMQHIQVTSATVDAVISLHDVFEDAEDADEALAYQIVDVSNSDLFDAVTIDGSGDLVLNAAAGMSGRSTITIGAMDSNGAIVTTTLTADVSYENAPPQLEWTANYCGTDTWLIGGAVTDADDDVRGMIVEFHGVFDVRATVQADGTFEFTIIIDPAEWGMEWAFVLDWHGAMSDPEVDQIVLS
jgi:hypothetical protein